MTNIADTDINPTAFKCPRCEQVVTLEVVARHPSAKTEKRREESLVLPPHSFDPNRDLSAFNDCPFGGSMVTRPGGELELMFDPTEIGSKSGMPGTGVTYYDVHTAISENVRASCSADHSGDGLGFGRFDGIEVDVDDAVSQVIELFGSRFADAAYAHAKRSAREVEIDSRW